MSNAPTTPVRLKDIARDLNVSVMTASKVVRGCADVGAETRSRVLARIKELNYQPNWVARSNVLIKYAFAIPRAHLSVLNRAVRNLLFDVRRVLHKAWDSVAAKTANAITDKTNIASIPSSCGPRRVF